MVLRRRAAMVTAAPRPVLVVGAPRSGAGPFARWLQEALVPAGAQPVPLHEVIRRPEVDMVLTDVLSVLDRDWTCPPARLPPAVAGTERLRDLLGVRADDVVTVVADSRLLFTLGAWSDLQDVAIVGVTRDHEATVRSLADRDRLQPYVADTVARAHTRRLQWVQERLDVPIVDMGAPPADRLDQARAVLAWLDPAAPVPAGAPGWDDPVEQSRGRAVDPAQAALSTIAADAADIGAWPPPGPDPSAMAAMLDQVADADELDELDRHAGPRSTARRLHAWAKMPLERAAVVEVVSNAHPRGSGAVGRPGGVVVECSDPAELQLRLEEVDALEAVPEGAVLADLTSWVPPEGLAAVLALVVQRLAGRGLVVVGVADADMDVARRRFGHAVQIDELVDLARGAGLGLVSRHDAPGMAVARLVRLADARAEPGDQPATAGARASSPTTTGHPVTLLAHPTDPWQARYEGLQGSPAVQAALRVGGWARRAGGDQDLAQVMDQLHPGDWKRRYELLAATPEVRLVQRASRARARMAARMQAIRPAGRS